MGHIFISYSHRDLEYAHQLADNLQEQGLDVWIDARLDYGSHWPVELQKQLDSCDAFILIMPPHSYASEWVQNELQRANRKQKPIFPLLLEGEEPWLSVKLTQYYDVRGGKLPDAKFYSDITRVVPAPVGQANRGLDPANQAVPLTSVANPPKPRAGRAASLALISVGAIALLAAAVFITWSLSRRGSASPSVNGLTSQTSTPSSDNPVAPIPTTVISDPVATAVANPTAAAEIKNSQGVSMIRIPAGNFTAGSQNGYENEKPVHTVYLDDFYIDKYEVTNGLFKKCVDAGECQPPEKTSSMTRESYFGNPEFDDYPVIYVSWDNARDYCQWRGMDLPTEAQWEKAARGTDGRVYPWGNEIDPAYVNFNEYVGDTTKVGSYEDGKSPYGVYDMAGNAWEWVADWYSETYYLDTYNLNTPLTNPTGPRSGEYKVLRGGSWHDDATIVTTSNRGWNQLELFYNKDFGFRCASDGMP